MIFPSLPAARPQSPRTKRSTRGAPPPACSPAGAARGQHRGLAAGPSLTLRDWGIFRPGFPCSLARRPIVVPGGVWRDPLPPSGSSGGGPDSHGGAARGAVFGDKLLKGTLNGTKLASPARRRIRGAVPGASDRPPRPQRLGPGRAGSGGRAPRPTATLGYPVRPPLSPGLCTPAATASCLCPDSPLCPVSCSVYRPKASSSREPSAFHPTDGCSCQGLAARRPAGCRFFPPSPVPRPAECFPRAAPRGWKDSGLRRPRGHLLPHLHLNF